MGDALLQALTQFMINVHTWYNDKTSDIIKMFKDAQDAFGGNMLDNTVIPMFTEVAMATHQRDPKAALIFGGKNLGIRPMEMVLMGLGGCTSIDVIDILKKSRQAVTDCVTQLTAERASTIPAVFTKIHIHFVVTGRALKQNQVARAIDLSATKYCSATLMLQRGGVEITHDYEIVEAAAE